MKTTRTYQIMKYSLTTVTFILNFYL